MRVRMRAADLAPWAGVASARETRRKLGRCQHSGGSPLLLLLFGVAILVVIFSRNGRGLRQIEYEMLLLIFRVADVVFVADVVVASNFCRVYW